MALNIRLFPTETDGNYRVSIENTPEIIQGVLLPDSLLGNDGYLRREPLFFNTDIVAEAPPAPANISFVGGQTSNTLGRTTDWTPVTFALTGGSDSTPQAGDFVLVHYAIGQNSSTAAPTATISSPTDYTAETNLNAVVTGRRVITRYFWKVMGGTPDTTITPGPTENTADPGVITILVFRGVDPTTPFDGVTATTMTGTGTGAGQNKPNPAAITPNSAGAWVVAFGGQASGAGAVFTEPATGLDSGKFWSALGNDTNDVSGGGGYYSGWTSGPVDVDIFEGGSSSSTNAQAAYTLVLKPAAGGGGGTTYDRAAAFNSVSTLALLASITYNRQVQTTSSSSLTAAAQVIRNRQVQIDSVSNLSATGVKLTARNTQINSVSTMSAVATITRNRQALSSSASTLTATATATRNRQVTINSVSTLSAIGVKPPASRSALMSSVSTLAVVASVRRNRQVAINSVSTLATVAKITRNRQALASSVSTLAAVAKVTANRQVSINSTSSFSAFGVSSGAVGGKIKYYNGSAFVEKPVKWYNGSIWVEKPVKVWTGSAWVLA